MNPEKEFKEEVVRNVSGLSGDEALHSMSREFIEKSSRFKYTYNFRWLGRPIIQYPQDIAAMQELIWEVRPDVIVETGIAHGGSLVFSASMLALLDYSDAIQFGSGFAPGISKRKVIGVDIDIRAHNRAAIEAHPMAHMIRMFEGSSVDAGIVEQVRLAVSGHERVLVCLDSNHTHDHVLAELNAYAPLVTKGSYCVVFDTVIEHMPEGMFPDRPWGPGNNPLTAVREYLASHPEFEVDRDMDHKLLISVAPFGYLRRVR